MTGNLQHSHLLDVFPFLRAVPTAEWEGARTTIQQFPAKTRIFQKEDASLYAMFLLRGTALITLIGENGSESVLNVLSAGEVCSLMLLSGLSGRDYPGSIIAETDVEALFVSKNSFLRWVQDHESIRHAVFGGLLDGTLRMSERLGARQTVPVEARLAKALLRVTSEEQPLFQVTHQELAAQIGSAREVVSRVLQRFQRKGWIEAVRGRVQILQRRELETLLGD
ncbi:Crp/Fnr family transcriptional regulator [Paenibacillus mesophilus]|uniref:Crp/Fnr family transcriptional regulator n=1 Tax=Paenibacillus mesophilus TaxID=2582849 RepID=UPI00110EBA05|nr:Crp/Fnr family transcriptional regulator [Paenibacillus mesophilus]TMV49535.1 Crp/Fnr family transcriptional regulator [Paenibacillus mesophilus]